MLTSMTGYGEAQLQAGGLSVRAEVRSVNNRHFKLNCRLPEGYATFESRIESLVRDQVRRGTVYLTLHIDHQFGLDDYRINEHVLTRYHQQLTGLGAKLHNTSEIPLASLLHLPGVVHEASRTSDQLEDEWPAVEQAIQQSLGSLGEMRRREGAAMASDLLENCRTIRQELESIRGLVPAVVESYQNRLLERLNQLLAQHDVAAEPTMIVREVGLYADRVDIAEEIVRLGSHLQQFERIMETEAAPGRKLDFLTQELLRETNTIGSKANDARIAAHVVQIKTHLERLREMIQNVE